MANSSWRVLVVLVLALFISETPVQSCKQFREMLQAFCEIMFTGRDDSGVCQHLADNLGTTQTPESIQKCADAFPEVLTKDYNVETSTQDMDQMVKDAGCPGVSSPCNLLSFQPPGEMMKKCHSGYLDFQSKFDHPLLNLVEGGCKRFLEIVSEHVPKEQAATVVTCSMEFAKENGLLNDEQFGFCQECGLKLCDLSMAFMGVKLS